MSIQVSWTSPAQTCLRLDVAAAWDWIDYQFAIGISAGKIEAQDHPIDVLVVPNPGAFLPPGAFPQFRHSLGRVPANVGTICIVVGQNTVFSLFMGAFIKSCPDLCRNVALVDTLDEARLRLADRILVELA